MFESRLSPGERTALLCPHCLSQVICSRTILVIKVSVKILQCVPSECVCVCAGAHACACVCEREQGRWISFLHSQLRGVDGGENMLHLCKFF